RLPDHSTSGGLIRHQLTVPNQSQESVYLTFPDQGRVKVWVHPASTYSMWVRSRVQCHDPLALIIKHGAVAQSESAKVTSSSDSATTVILPPRSHPMTNSPVQSHTASSGRYQTSSSKVHNAHSIEWEKSINGG